MIEPFFSIMEKEPFQALLQHNAIAVGVSGGPDSMALAYLLSRWSSEKKGPRIHIISVDHGLRPEAADEAELVGRVSAVWPKTEHFVLKWEGGKPGQRVQESAREARYTLMDAHCKAQDVCALMLAHHRDDQAETVLFRLAKGSGLDGLSGMRRMQQRGDLNLYRPLLDIPKDVILSFCAAKKIPFIDDPSNNKDQYARVRLRQSRAALEREGITSKRLAVTAKRLNRARNALEYYSAQAFKDHASIKDSVRIVLNLKPLSDLPEETLLRVIMLGMEYLHPSDGYKPRTEKLEALVFDLLDQTYMKPRTLGGVIFSRKDNELTLLREHAK